MNSEKKRRVPLFLLVTALYWFALYSYVPTLSTYAIKIGASLSMVGLISGSYGLMQLIARLPIGILSDRFRQRKLYIILGLGFTALAAAGMMTLRTPTALLIFRAVSGIAASMWVAFTVLYSGYFSPEQSVKAIGVINAVNLAGQSLANFLGGALNEAFSTDYAGFWLAVIAGVIGFILSFFITEDRSAKDDKEPIRLIDLADVAKNKALIATSILAIMAQFISFSAIISFAPVLAKDLGASDAQLGLLSMLATIPGIFTSMLAGSAGEFSGMSCTRSMTLSVLRLQRLMSDSPTT